MNIVELTFQANEQNLELLTYASDGKVLRFASDTVAYIWGRFALGENWTGFDSVRAIWKFGPHIYASVLDSEGLVKIPHEVFAGTTGEVQVNLVGSVSDGTNLIERLTSYPVLACRINKKALVDGENSDPIEPSQIEQFAHNVKEDADRAEQAKEDARGFASDASGFADEALGFKNDTASLKQDVEGLKQDVEGLKSDVIELKDETLGYKNDTAGLKADVIELKGDVEGLKSDVIDLKDETLGYKNDTAQLKQDVIGLKDTTKGYMDHTDEVASEIHNLSTATSTLPAGSQATSSYDHETGILSLGIPKGDKGDKGDTGNVNYAVCDLDPETGHLFMVYDENYTGPSFNLREDDGHLEVII